MMHPQLYCLDSKGRLRTWYCETDSINGRFRIFDGLADGKVKSSEWTQALPMNLGKANATSAIEQAEKEVQALYKKKRKGKYYDDAEDAKAGNRFFAPMLAETYDGNFPLWKPLYVQPKLDGIRAIATYDGFFSRRGEKFASTAHLEAELKEFFTKNPTAILDGELYNHDLKEDFNELSSLIKKKNPDPERLLEIQDMVQYHVYDFPSSPGGFGKRSFALHMILPTSEHIQLVETKEIEGKPEDKVLVDDLYALWLSQKYEGQMIRHDEPYENKRSDFLLKRKEKQDGEFPLKALLEGKGNWAGYAKTAVIELPNGETQEAGVKGTKAFTKKLLLMPLPKFVTVEYLNLTPGGKLRGPIATRFYDEEGKI